MDEKTKQWLPKILFFGGDLAIIVGVLDFSSCAGTQPTNPWFACGYLYVLVGIVLVIASYFLKRQWK